MLLLLLAACEPPGVQRASRIDLAGEWDWMDGFTEFPKSCGSHATIQYHSSGKYFLWGEAGSWRLEGTVLTETMTGFDPLHVDRSAEDVGRPNVSTLQWVDQNTFLKHYADGGVRAFRRCPRIN